MRFCKICKKEKPKEEFASTYGKPKDGIRKKYYERHRCLKCVTSLRNKKRNIQHAILFSNSWYSKRFHLIKCRAKKRNLSFSLTIEDLKKITKDKKCFYCDETEGMFHIDRVDNRDGYEFNNCVFACYKCNVAKKATEIERFFCIIDGIRRFYEK